jgi:hypothetical protein
MSPFVEHLGCHDEHKRFYKCTGVDLNYYLKGGKEHGEYINMGRKRPWL